MGDVVEFSEDRRKEKRYAEWNEVVPGDWSTLPEDGSDVTYRFHPIDEIDSEWDGQYEEGVFYSKGGFCDTNDVTHWIYR